jgi:hypothetical protein
VSSKPSSIVKAINNMGNSQGILTYVSNDNVKRKLFNIINAKLVKKNGKRMVKMEVSTEKIKATGKCAKEAIKIKNFSAKDASLNITSLSSENNLLLPGVAITPESVRNQPGYGNILFASQNRENRGYWIGVDIGNQSIARTDDALNTYSIASWNEENATLRIWLRNNNRNNYTLNVAVFPNFLINAYASSRTPLILRNNDGRLTYESGEIPQWITIYPTSVSTSDLRGPCISIRNCLRLRYS